MSDKPEDPMSLEIAVTPEGKVSVNIQHLPMGADGWGHLTFTVSEAIDFVIALQHATATAHQMTQQKKVKENGGNKLN